MTPSTTCSGDARSPTATCRRSRPSTRRPSIRWRSPSARSSRSSATRAAPRGALRRSPRSCSWPWGIYRLTRTAFTPIVATVAVALLLHALQLQFLAARGYVDLAYCAAIVWAAALEVERPRRGTAVFVAAAGGRADPARRLASGRPLLAVVRARTRAGGARIRWAAIVVAAPLVWVALDWVVTGQPLYSLHRTQDTAVALGRTVPLAQLPETLSHYLIVLTKSAVLRRRASPASCSSAWLVPRRMVAPFVVLLSGIGTFVVLAGAGLSVIDRYLLMPAVMILIFCAFALTGWTMLERGLLRGVGAAAPSCWRAIGIYLAASTLSLNKIETELGFRDDSHTSLVADPRATRRSRRDLRCGPVSVPDHKLVPDVRIILDRGRRRRDRPRRRALPARQKNQPGALRRDGARRRALCARARGGPLRTGQPDRQPAGPGAHRSRRLHADPRPSTTPRTDAVERRPAAMGPPLGRRRRRSARARPRAAGVGRRAAACPGSTTSTRPSISCPTP